MKEYKVYLFDFDGTLIDSLESMEFVFIEALKKMGLEAKKEEVIQFLRQPLPVTFYEKGGKKEDLMTFDYWINVYLNSEDTVKKTYAFYDFKDTLNYLISKNKTIGIVTSNNYSHVVEVLTNLGIDSNIFKVIIGNQECRVHKPKPDPILKALEDLNYNDNYLDVVYIGDALDDMTSASEAKVDHILLDRNSERPDYQKLKINSLKELFYD